MKRNLQMFVLISSLAAFIVLLALLVTKNNRDRWTMESSSSNVISMTVNSPSPSPYKTSAPKPTVSPSGEEAQCTVAPKKETNKKKKRKKYVALTFDDGPDIKTTNRILNILKANDAKATFFVIGSQVNKAKKVIKRAKSLGCVIGNHTFNHLNLQIKSNKLIKYQVRKTSKYVKKIIGKGTLLVRPPYGSVNSRVKKAINKPMVLWSIDTMDWYTLNAKKVIRKVKKSVRDGDIILMHDIYPSTVKACKTIIPWLKKQGYELVTVPQLAKIKGKKLKNGVVYGSFKK